MSNVHAISLRVETTTDEQWQKVWTKLNRAAKKLGHEGLPSIVVSCCEVTEEEEHQDDAVCQRVMDLLEYKSLHPQIAKDAVRFLQDSGIIFKDRLK